MPLSYGYRWTGSPAGRSAQVFFRNIPQFSQSFDCPCPNLFEKCYWYQIQNKHVFTKIHADEAKRETCCLCSVFQIISNDHNLFYSCYTRHCNFFGVRIVPKALVYARNDGFSVVPFAVFSSYLMPVSNEMLGLQNTHRVQMSLESLLLITVLILFSLKRHLILLCVSLFAVWKHAELQNFWLHNQYKLTCEDTQGLLLVIFLKKHTGKCV